MFRVYVLVVCLLVSCSCREEALNLKPMDPSEIIMERPCLEREVESEDELLKDEQEDDLELELNEKPPDEVIERSSDNQLNEKFNSRKKELFRKKKDSSFIAYYTAEIGSQGLFDDRETATREGLRISELEDSSAYLGFEAQGWRVYPVWFYYSPEQYIKYYTLDFYP